MPQAGARLVLGLGNPGAEHEGTRHNLGFEVADRLAARLGIEFRRRGRSLVARAERDGVAALLAKPQTFMNLSGRAARELLDDLGPGAELLVVCDDYHLPLGRLRCRAGGSSGGQKGLESILALLPGREVPRLRLGVGEPPSGMPSEHYVLARFKRGELAEARAMVERAAESVGTWLEDGDLPGLVQRANAPPPA